MPKGGVAVPYKVLDFFAGAGGLSEGMRMAGLDVVYANEIDRWAKLTYAHNHSATFFHCGDISAVTQDTINRDLENRFGFGVDEIDMMAGGPPCQGFSIIGQRNINDPRNRLFKEFLRLVEQIQPKAFIMENVFGLLSMQDGKVKDEIIEAFTAVGYTVTKPEVLTACDFGVPQMRRRVFFLGIRRDLSNAPLVYPQPTHTGTRRLSDLAAYVTVGDAISDLPENVVESTGTDAGEAIAYRMAATTEYQRLMRGKRQTIYNHHTKRFLDTRMERILNLNEGATKVSLPAELQTGGHENKDLFVNSDFALWRRCSHFLMLEICPIFLRLKSRA